MFRFFLPLFLTVGILCSSEAQVNEQDSLALVALYESTDGDNWRNDDNWLQLGQNVGEWFGVSIEGGSVISLNLTYNNLMGSIPTEIGNLVNLKSLELRRNLLTGSIPVSIGNLVNLINLELYQNELEGSIPTEIGHLTSIKVIKLFDNQFSGAIPSSLGNLSDLEILELSKNQLTGSLPNELGSLSSLSHLSLGTNQLSGSIPSSLGNLSNLEQLGLAYNQLTGSIPNELGNLSSLTQLTLSDNQLSGNIPRELAQIPNLRTIFLQDNQLTGNIPPELGGLVNLSQLNLIENSLTGKIPTEFGDLTNLDFLRIDDNQLSGSLPLGLTNIEGLAADQSWKVFSFSGTNLCEPVDQVWIDWKEGRNIISSGLICEEDHSLYTDSLALVALYESTDGDNWINNDNWLEGPVESWFGITVNDDFRVSHLNMNSNRLIGSIPNGLGQLTELTSLLLSSNELTGEIPEDLGNLSELYELSLSRNYLSGIIPSSLGNLTKAVQINISGNQLEGNVPENIFLIDGLSTLWVGNNPLSGPLPAAVTLTTAQNMTFFNTDLCIPSNQSFELWCDNNYICHALKFCDDPSISTLDSLNLVYIYENLGGENWTNSTGWLTAPVVLWHGITVANGRVTEIDLSNNNLIGELLTGWVNGVNYTAVDLSGNDLSGQLPTGIGDMYSLMNLNLSATNLEGKIPSEIIYSRSLTHLDFSNTSLCEPTTVAYINFTQGLQEYGATVTCDYLGADVQDSLALVAFYQATQGLSWRRNDHWLDTPVHEWYGVKLDGDGKVISLELSANTINGQLPTMLPILLELDQLEILNLQDNLLIDGPIPNSIDGFTNLRILNLSYCQLGGSIPVEIGNMTTLEVLGLSGNNLYDEVPASIYSLSKLQALAFDGNNLHGLVLEQVSDLTELSTFVIYDNPLLCEPISSDYLDWAGDLSLYINSNTCAAPYGDFVKDSLALIALYESTDGDNWTNNENWLTGDVDTWYGVTVEDGRVIEIVLDSPDGSEEIQNQIGNNMIGVIPIELYSLTKLKILDLSSNDISGSLSNEIENLSELRVLDLFSNDLSGGIPKEVFDLESLEKLQLVDNNLSGTLPPSIGDGSQLNELLLAGNQIAGSIPLELGNLSELTKLSLGFNDLEGVIPTELGSLTKLETLFLGNNRINGPVPAELGNLNKLERLEISNNDLSGSIPLSFVNLENLGLGEARIKFDYSNTNLCEPLDQAYQDWKEGRNIIDNGVICDDLQYSLYTDSLALVALYESTDGDNWSFQENWLTGSLNTWSGVNVVDGRVTGLLLQNINLDGSLPPEISNLTQLQGATLSHNKLNGGLEYLTEIDELSYLDAGYNSFSGEIPTSLSDMPALSYLYLEHNQFAGSIPSEILNIATLEHLNLSSNNLEGDFPQDFNGVPSLKTLSLADNGLEGSFPESLSNLSGLSFINLSGNNLSGSIPDDLWSLPELSGVNLQSNKLSGQLSIAIGNAVNLESLSLSYNLLSGDLPEELGNLVKLNWLTFEYNNFEGEFPSSITSLTDLTHLLFGSNQLTGVIPSGITNLSSVVSFDLSNNTGLCEPETSEYINWTSGLDTYRNSNICIPTNDLKSDSLALVALYESTDGDNWTNNTNWLIGDVDTWYGVTVDNNRVYGLSLAGNGLSGNLPEEFSDLTAMVTVLMGRNEISGNLPTSIGRMSSLEHLDLTDNSIHGQIPPGIGDLSKLELLSLRDNDLSGMLPLELGHLSNLSILEVTSGNLQGAIPSSFENLSNLTILDLSSNELSGELPDFLTSFSKLRRLELDSNRFVGGIPEDIGSLTSLEWIFLNSNNLQGGIPKSVEHLLQLRLLVLSGNDMDGSIPPEIGSLESLKALWLDNNNFSGELPSEIGQLSELFLLNISNTNISGALPAEVGALTELQIMDLSNTNLEGSLPLEITNLSILANAPYPDYVFDLSNTDICEPQDQAYQDWKEGRNIVGSGLVCEEYSLYTDSLALVALYESTDGDNWTNNANWLTGDIDTWYGVTIHSDRVIMLELNGNNLNGSLPAEIGDLTALTHLSLEENNISGSIPTEVGFMSELQLLYIHTNELSGSIPQTFGLLSNLEDLHLASNSISGNLPPEIGNMSSLRSIDLGDNELTGEIPKEISQLALLENLVLNRNNFSGAIPPEIGLLTSLDYFSFTDNNLSGTLPDEIGDMRNLRVFDIENNNLSGELPVSMALLDKLEKVYLSRNQLTGTVPRDFLELDLLSDLSIIDNLFDSLPNVSATKPDLRLSAHTNRLTFTDLEPNIAIFESVSQYSPQRQFGFTQTVSINGSSDAELSQPSVGGTANNYQWYKDNELIEGATEQDYEIENPSLESEGTYVLRVTNTLVPGLTLESHPIELIYEPRTEKEILSYSIPGEFAPADIDQSGRSITAYLPCDAPDISIPTFEVSGGAQAFVDDEAQVSVVTSVDLSDPVAYTVVAEDGSEALWTVTVTNPNPIDVFSTISHLSSCNTSSGSITLDSIRLDSDQMVILPNSRYSLQWSNASTGHQIEVSSEGNYSVEVTDNETGCSYTRSFEVLTKDLEGALSLREKRDNTSCGVANGFISVDANIGGSLGLGFAWHKGTTASGAVIGLTKAIDNLEAGSYTLVVTDLDSDCTTSLTETLEDAQQVLDISLKSTANKSCTTPAGTVELTTITVDGEERTSTLGYRIEWSQTEDFENVLAQTREVNGLASGTYYARLIGVATACKSPVRSVTVVDDQPSLTFNVSTTPNNRCDDTGNGSATLTSLPENHQIQWYRGETLLQGKTSSSINALTSGSYMAVVTDKTSGCEATSTFEIETATSAITLEVTSNENTSCGEPIGEARVVAVLVGEQRTTNLEAFSFEWWLPNEEARLIQGRTSTLSNVLGGDYFVQVTLDSIGCQSAPLEVTVDEDIQNFAVALTQSRPDLPGAQGTGQLQVEILEQPEEYTISWYEGDLPTGFVIGESTTLDNVNAGLYTMLVTDQRTGCEVTATFEVGVDERLAQEIGFDLPEIVNIADLPLTLEATSDQGLPVSFTVVEGQGTISQNQLTAEAKGTITIKAYNEGTTAVAYAESIRTVKVVSDFYLTGTVTGAADGSQVSGEVVVFTLDGEVFAQNSFTDGSYFIDGLREGKYRLLIEVTGAFNALAFDTYYNRQLLWNRATILTINDDTEVNVELIPKTTGNMTGTGSITGRVVRTDGGSRIVVGRTLDGTPLADVDIYLYDSSTNDVVAQSKTDDDGVFLFDNIPSGQYYFRIDAVGFEITDLGAEIDYDEEEGTLQISAALGQEGLTVEYVVVSGVEEALLKDISIYPNPVQNILHVEDALNRIRSIQFLNLAGQLTRTFNAAQDGQYDISSLTNGMYMMRIELEGKQLVHYKVLVKD